MANKLRNYPKIKGIKIGNMEYLISQFADNTDLYLSFDQETISSTFRVLSGIETSTGLCVNYDKTIMYRVGSLANSSAKFITPKKVNWSNDFVNTLQVNLYNDSKDRDQNIIEIVNKMHAVYNMRYYRTMTVTGKITVINSLMSSLFVYNL